MVEENIGVDVKTLIVIKVYRFLISINKNFSLKMLGKDN